MNFSGVISVIEVESLTNIYLATVVAVKERSTTE